LTRKNRRPSDVGRAEILAAATQSFGRDGYERTSLQAIGAAAGVSRGLPAYFFKDKEALYRAVMERAAAAVREHVIEGTRKSAAGDSKRFVADFVDRYFAFLGSHAAEVRLLQWDLLQPVGERRQEVLRDLFTEGAQLFKGALNHVSLNPQEVRDLLSALVGMCLYPSFVGRRTGLGSYKRQVIAMMESALAAHQRPGNRKR
jgi:AcrR family transcriptional regulator